MRAGALAEVLGCRVETPARASTITFDARHLDADIPPAVADVLGLFAPARGASFGATVEDMVARALVAGDATIVSTARRLGVSSRTLQRRLADEGTTFERLVDAARRRLAGALLAKGVAIAETGALLGYADKAAFYRAFRRWHRTTPDTSRRARLADRAP
jgi:AraC-like DNA-binding protein